jgi:hypothetical protein
MAGNLARDVVGAARDGFATVADEERQRRLGICKTCPEYDPTQGRCVKFGCVSKLKARIASSKCPIGLW